LEKKLRPVTDEQKANTTVAILLKINNQNFRILFVRRAKNIADPWSGQIGFPRGKRELEDETLKQTVIRETKEEAGVNLLQGCRFLGAIDAQRTKTRPDLKVLPFVVLLQDEPVIKLNPRELQTFFWVSIGQLAENGTIVELASEKQPAYVVRKKVVWGLTYRILENFFHTLKLQ
jgi:8-oxo-dGTP pyrophosphatase MutT (NUDIX family)